MAATNIMMSCLTSEAALSGDCGFLSANMYEHHKRLNNLKTTTHHPVYFIASKPHRNDSSRYLQCNSSQQRPLALNLDLDLASASLSALSSLELIALALLPQFFLPIRSQENVARTRHRILVDPNRRAKESAVKVIALVVHGRRPLRDRNPDYAVSSRARGTEAAEIGFEIVEGERVGDANVKHEAVLPDLDDLSWLYSESIQQGRGRG
jgi:hypothetical protein